MGATSLCVMWVGLGLMMSAISVPLILGRVPRNGTYGFRTPKTLSSDDIWYPANRYSGWGLALAGLISAAGALVLIRFAPGMRLA